jgi:predicted TIM-barrel fold metal-dependent hydrolase
MIDDHAHPFALEYVPLELDQVSLDVDGPDAEARRRRVGAGRLFQELCTRKLGELLGVGDDATDEEVAAARDEAARDWGAYVRRLFDDAGINGMVLDFGVGNATPDALDTFRELMGRPVWWLARIDPVVDDLVGRGAGAAEIVSAVEAAMSAAAGSGAVGFKTIAAYRTGLAVDPAADLRSAQASLDADRREDLPVRRRGKALRDLVTRTVLERAADLDRPVQFHTGFGDSEIRLAESDPLLLEELLRSPAGQAATIVLIHGSHPWHEELAYLATVHPNVHAELSLSNLFAPLGTGERLLRLVELAPRDKVLVGSDGHHLPETHWFGCRVARDGFEEAAAQLRAAGARPGYVDTLRAAVFEGNAGRVYGLG